MPFSEYKREIFSAVFGGLVVGVLSLSIGLYTLKSTFDLNLRKELRHNLRVDIALLKNVEVELDKNLELLLNNNYTLLFRSEEAEVPIPPLGEDEEDEELDEKLTDWLKDLIRYTGGIFKVTEISVPKELFVADAWETYGPRVSDIDFQLIQDLNTFYRQVRKANEYLEVFQRFSFDMRMMRSEANTANFYLDRYTELIVDITQKNILDLKNGVTRDIARLEEERSEIKL